MVAIGPHDALYSNKLLNSQKETNHGPNVALAPEMNVNESIASLGPNRDITIQRRGYGDRHYPHQLP